jgi:large subunit ribosomal protein L25
MPREMKATVRTEKGRHAAQRLRINDQIPAVIYREGKVGTNLAIARNEWLKVLASGERVITLKIEGGDRQALIKDVQYDSVGDETLHVDFNELREGQNVRVAVALVLKGTPKGQAKGGILMQPVHTIHVECLPTAIPDKIIIDVEPLDLDQALHVKEIKLPQGVLATDPPELVVVTVHEPRVEEAAPTAAEGAPTEPEVLKEKKEEPAEGAAPAAGAKAAEKKDEKKDAKK